MIFTALPPTSISRSWTSRARNRSSRGAWNARSFLTLPPGSIVMDRSNRNAPSSCTSGASAPVAPGHLVQGGIVHRDLHVPFVAGQPREAGIVDHPASGLVFQLEDENDEAGPGFIHASGKQIDVLAQCLAHRGSRACGIQVQHLEPDAAGRLLQNIFRLPFSLLVLCGRRDLVRFLLGDGGHSDEGEDQKQEADLVTSRHVAASLCQRVGTVHAHLGAQIPSRGIMRAPRGGRCRSSPRSATRNLSSERS